MPENYIHIIMKQQEGPNWCYSSIIEAIVKYYNKRPNNISLTQRNIASIVANNSCINGMQDPYKFLNGRGYIAGLTTAKLAWTTITNEIDAGRPIILLVGEHYIILNGYKGNSLKDPNRILYFLDPLLPGGGPVPVKGTDFVTYGFPTDYKHTGKKSYEPQRGYILTKAPFEI